MNTTNGSMDTQVSIPNGGGVELKDRILAAREKLGLTQYDLAQRAGLQHATYQKVETGERGERVSAVVVLKIARALGTTVEALLGPDVPWPAGIRPQGAPSPAESKRIDALERKVDSLLEGLEAVQKQLRRQGRVK